MEAGYHINKDDGPYTSSFLYIFLSRTFLSHFRHNYWSLLGFYEAYIKVTSGF
jgi:hypothetical protein